MPTTRPGDDDSGEEEFEGYEPEYHPGLEEAGELWCPKCGAVMHADADRCPRCGDYVTPGLAPPKPGSLWIRLVAVLLVLLLLGGAFAALLGR